MGKVTRPKISSGPKWQFAATVTPSLQSPKKLQAHKKSLVILNRGTVSIAQTSVWDSLPVTGHLIPNWWSRGGTSYCFQEQPGTPSWGLQAVARRCHSPHRPSVRASQGSHGRAGRLLCAQAGHLWAQFSVISTSCLVPHSLPCPSRCTAFAP